MEQAADILSLVTTVGSEDDARRLAELLLERRLAACVQLDRGVESHYRWEGKACVDAEVRLTIKSAPDRLEPLQAFLADEHPYDLPQLVWQVDRASAAYAAWVRAEVSSGS
jgi:periplasmic divalent cation tolerance protein